MHITHLRKVGGSVMIPVPPAILDILHLQADAAVCCFVEGSHLIIESKPRPNYTLKELLSQCNASKPVSAKGRQWSNSKRVGRELL